MVLLLPHSNPVLLSPQTSPTMAKPSSSSSLNASSFTEDFVALWNDLLCRLCLTYTYLSVESKAVNEIFTFLREAKPKFLPADHPFITNFDEFCTTFSYGLRAFSENKSVIEWHAIVEGEYFNKIGLATQAEKVYFDWLRVLKPVWRMQKSSCWTSQPAISKGSWHPKREQQKRQKRKGWLNC